MKAGLAPQILNPLAGGSPSSSQPKSQGSRSQSSQGDFQAFAKSYQPKTDNSRTNRSSSHRPQGYQSTSKDYRSTSSSRQSRPAVGVERFNGPSNDSTAFPKNYSYAERQSSGGERLSPGSAPQIQRSGGAIDPLNERIAMQRFLKDMKELGVDAGELMFAFANLTPEQLQLAPEQNSDLIFGQLGLTPGQRRAAEESFFGMLENTRKQTTESYLNSDDRRVSLSLLSQRDLNRQKMNTTIDEMNQNFFVANKKPEVGLNAQGAPQETVFPLDGQKTPGQRYDGIVATTGMEVAEPVGEESRLSGLAGLAAKRSAAAPTSSMMSANSAQGVGGLNEELVPQQEVQGLSKEQELVRKLDQSLAELQKTFSTNGSSTNRFSTNGIVSAETPEAMAVASEASPITQGQGSSGFAATDMSSLAGLSLSESTSDSSDGQEFESSDHGAEASAELSGQGQTITKDSEFVNKIKSFIPAGEASAEDMQKNVDEIVERSNLMVKKGGGEMKIKLNPEGLGELRLRVDVKDGAVNVEMLAESESAKKILEKGLGDLKSTLAMNNMKLEDLKVDVSNNLSDMLEQRQQEQEQNLARQFLGDFKRQNEGFRQAFFDIGMAGYTQQTGDDENARIQAMEASAKKSGSSRRLDLVA